MPAPAQFPAMAQDATFLEMLALLKRRLPVLFVQRWEGVTGEGLMAATARVFAELMRRVESQTGSSLLREATGAIKATGTVSITFDGATVNGYTIAAGTRIAKTPWGIEVVLTQALARADGAGAATVTRNVEARWAGDWGNVPDNMLREWAFNPDNDATLTWSGTDQDGKDEFLARVKAGTIWIAGSSRMTGGRLGTLDLRGAGRGVPRAVDEPDALYRPRIRTVPLDAITPAGIVRAVNKALGYDGAEIVEYWQTGFAWGSATNGGWGRHPWSRKLHAVVLVPEGVDLVSYQALVNELRLPGVYIRVLPKAG